MEILLGGEYFRGMLSLLGILVRKVLWGRIFLDGLIVGKNCKRAHCILWGCFDGNIVRGKYYVEYLWK